jgi:hypothetical protein
VLFDLARGTRLTFANLFEEASVSILAKLPLGGISCSGEALHQFFVLALGCLDNAARVVAIGRAANRAAKQNRCHCFHLSSPSSGSSAERRLAGDV